MDLAALRSIHRISKTTYTKISKTQRRGESGYQAGWDGMMENSHKNHTATLSMTLKTAINHQPQTLTPQLSRAHTLSLAIYLNRRHTENFSNYFQWNSNGKNAKSFDENSDDNETSKSIEGDSNNNSKNSPESTSSTNDFYKWSQCEDDNANDEKIYEELCYVTISSTFPSEVLITLC